MTQQTGRYAGLAAVAVLWSTLGAASVLSEFPLAGSRPLSWLAAEPSVAPLYAVGLAGGAVLLLAFHRYVTSNFPTGRGFSIAMLAGLAGQAVAAVVPIHGAGPAHAVHTVAALTLGASLPALIWRFAVKQPPGAWRRRCLSLAWLDTAACAAGVVLSRQSVAPLAEILPAACFHLWIAVVTLAPGRAAEAGQTVDHGDAEAHAGGPGPLPVGRSR
jgi:hypothetical protein